MEQTLTFRPLQRYLTTLFILISITGLWLYLYNFRINHFINKQKTNISSLISQQKKTKIQLQENNKVQQDINLLKKELSFLQKNMKEENIFSSIMKNIRIAGLTLATCKNKKNIKRSKYLNNSTVDYEITGSLNQINNFLSLINKKNKHPFICKNFSLKSKEKSTCNLKCTFKNIFTNKEN